MLTVATAPAPDDSQMATDKTALDLLLVSLAEVKKGEEVQTGLQHHSAFQMASINRVVKSVMRSVEADSVFSDWQLPTYGAVELP